MIKWFEWLRREGADERVVREAEEDGTVVFDNEVAEKAVSSPSAMFTFFENVPNVWHRRILNYEGGYVNHPADRGGETNLGITLSTLNRAKKAGLCPAGVRIRDLNKHPKVVYDIYNEFYYRECLCHKVPAMLSFAFHDACVNHGRGGRNSGGAPIGAGMLMQDVMIKEYAASISFDGVVGPASVKALMDILQWNDVDWFTEQFNDRRELYFRRIAANNPSQRVFLNGWLNRLEKVRDFCRKWVI